MSQREIYRILDVAANRGREALRVIEDAARFLDDNEVLTATLKRTRHRFAAASEKIDRRERLLARDTPGDVGTRLETSDEYRRTSLADVLAANFARLQESARSLEEFSKIVAPQLAREWERIRYDSYTLEKLTFAALTDEETREATEEETPSTDALDGSDLQDDEGTESETDESEERETSEETSVTPEISASFFWGASRNVRESRRARLNNASLCVYVDRALTDSDAESLFLSGVDVFQLCYASDKDIEETANEFLRQWLDRFDGRAPKSRPLLLSRGFSLWGDAFDGGVLLEQNWNEARSELGADVLIGATASTLDDALLAFEAGRAGAIDFLELGPTFPSDSVCEGTGVTFLRAVVEAVEGVCPIPVFAYGGITPENCEAVFDSGVERVGVGAAIMNASDKRFVVSRLKCMF